jgi:DNA excision repair protein ERCC-4
MPCAPDPIQVVADDREDRCGVARLLACMEGVEVVVKRLSMGDYCADDTVLFERKTLADFALSIVDGRLFRQTIRLANSAYRCVLILEGTAADHADTGVRREAMQGALITISLILGIPVLRSRDPQETAGLIVYAARQVRIAARGGVQRSGYRPKGKRKRQSYILQGLPGIGPERAARLLDRFGSVEGAICASSEELQSVEGIGRRTAEKIRWAVCENRTPYGVAPGFPL